ncbi:hypothetical protein NDU88_005686 [Pleurodeles waltl]|uniref:Uncharacterized protein n=1 Tax=Pleurodeles waltl TaxID=8319 RepID=A0AAV7SMH0_PLEWA|nr:hypothetical protein NDU88_005686 [Pleurodeles waltl]
MADGKVQEAMRLLREAGRLNLIQGGVGGPSRPSRRASSGVAAAVLACSTSRGGARKQPVSRRGGGRARVRAGDEGRSGRGRPFESHRVVPLGSLVTRGATVRARASMGGAAAAGGRRACGRGPAGRGPAHLLAARSAAVGGRAGMPHGRVLAAARSGVRPVSPNTKDVGGEASGRGPAPQEEPDVFVPMEESQPAAGSSGGLIQFSGISLGRLVLAEMGAQGAYQVVIVAEEQVQRGLGRIRNVTTGKGGRADNILVGKKGVENNRTNKDR